MSHEIATLFSGEIVPGIKVESNPGFLGGIQYVVTFPNGRGASIVHHDYSYGVELAVLDSEGNLDYSTPITDDVLPYLEPEDLVIALNRIAAL